MTTTSVEGEGSHLVCATHLLRRFFTGRSHRNGSINPVINNMSVAVSRVLQRVVRYLNPLMRLVLAGRAHRIMSGRLVLLSFTGRRTGRSYTTPVSYVRDGSDLLIPGGGAWWKNLTTGSARVRLQGTWHVVTSEVIQEPGALSKVLGRMLAVNPAIAVFTGIRPGPDGRPVAKSLERECRRGFVVVRLHINGEVSSAEAAVHGPFFSTARSRRRASRASQAGDASG
jgi:deazaflavin-dependent oxidoreductase (nitroreductase family)